MCSRVLAVLFLVFCPILIAQQTLNNDSIIKLVKAGLSDDLILSTIKAAPGAYDISADGIIALKSGGASDKVVTAIVLKASETTAAPSAQRLPTAPGNAQQINSESPTATSPGRTAEGAEPPASTEAVELGSASGSRPVNVGARVVIAPMGGFETYFAAAVREKRVPITLTLDKATAQYFVVSTNTEWQGFVFGSGGTANWTRAGGNASYGSAGGSTRGLEASIMLIDAKSKDVVWAYEVHKSSHGALIFGSFGARGQQSIAEACAKHLKEYLEKGK